MPRPTPRAAVSQAAAAIAGALLLVGTACAAEPVPAAPDNPAPEASEPLVTPPSDASSHAGPENEAETSPAAPGFDVSQHSIDDPTSIWVVVNKLRPFDPLTFEPADLVMPEGLSNRNGQPLRQVAADAAVRMLEAAEADGVWFQLGSGYRDYARQEYLYTSYIARDGQAEADTYSARPGHSEHQTGLVADFEDGGSCTLSWCFADTAAGLWLAEHSAEFGWVLRYPEGSEHITGYMFEPWHFRYVGEDLAREMRDSGIATLEEFFELAPAPDYLR